LIIAIVSGKGGTGKTTVTANLATSLVKDFGKKVLAVDGNITTPNLAIHFGHTVLPKNTLIEVLNKQISIHEAIYKLPCGVHLLPSSLSMYISYPAPEVLVEKISEIKDEYDYILIDGAAGIGREIISTIKTSDKVLLVSNPSMTSIVAGIKVIKVVEACGKPVMGIVLNKVRNKKYELKPEKVEELCENEVISSIPFDEKLEESTATGTPLVLYDERSRGGKVLRDLAAKLAGRRMEEKKTLWDRIITMFNG
jgi:septum site-determining protein MinD